MKAVRTGFRGGPGCLSASWLAPFACGTRQCPHVRLWLVNRDVCLHVCCRTGLLPQFVDFLHVAHANNNVHNLRIMKALLQAGAVPPHQIEETDAADKVLSELLIRVKDSSSALLLELPSDMILEVGSASAPRGCCGAAFRLMHSDSANPVNSCSHGRMLLDHLWASWKEHRLPDLEANCIDGCTAALHHDEPPGNIPRPCGCSPPSFQAFWVAAVLNSSVTTQVATSMEPVLQLCTGKPRSCLSLTSVAIKILVTCRWLWCWTPR